MTRVERDRASCVAEDWFTELTRDQKEAILFDEKNHGYLSELWYQCPDAPDWLDSTLLPGITLVDRLDHNGMGIVCRAISKEGRVLCAKFPNYDGYPLDKHSDLDRSIRKEIEVLRRIQGVNAGAGYLPRLVSFGDVELLPGRTSPYILTEYVRDVTPLSRFSLRDRRSAIDLWARVARVVGILHSNGIVHGDLHSGNILVDTKGWPMILDFGNAQLRRGDFWGRRVERRQFGPLVALNVAEVAFPHRPLSYAFDVLCLAQRMQEKPTSAHFRTLKEIPSDVFQSSLNGKGKYEQSARFHLLLKSCMQPEPEYRVPNASQMSRAIADLSSGPPVASYKTLKNRCRVFLRQHTVLVFVTVTVFLVLASLTSMLLLHAMHLKSVSARQAEQAEKDAFALTQLRKANHAALQSMLELTRLTVQDDRLQGNRKFESRQVVSKRLAEMMKAEVLDLESSVTALRLAMEIVESQMEIDGWSSARNICSACLNYAQELEQREGNEIPVVVRLLGIQAEAKLAKIYFESDANNGGDLAEAKRRAISASERFLALLVDNRRNPEIVADYLHTGAQVAQFALYPQRDEPWLADSHCDLLWQVIQQSLNFTENPEEYFLEIADIRRIYGLALHKNAFDGSPRFSAQTHCHELSRAEYRYVLDLLAAVAATPNLGLDSEAVQHVEASVKSLLGMSLTSAGDYVGARAALDEAFAARSQLIEQSPGSLTRMREFIHTGWNYADVNRVETLMRFGEIDPTELLAQEIAIRNRVLEKCELVLVRDRNRDSEKNYLVNALRLADAQYAAGDAKGAAEVALRMDQLVQLSGRELGDVLSSELIIGLILIAQNTPEHEYFHELLETQLTRLFEHYRDVERTDTITRVRRLATYNRRFVATAHSLDLSSISKSNIWPEMESLLARALELEELPGTAGYEQAE